MPRRCIDTTLVHPDAPGAQVREERRVRNASRNEPAAAPRNVSATVSMEVDVDVAMDSSSEDEPLTPSDDEPLTLSDEEALNTGVRPSALVGQTALNRNRHAGGPPDAFRMLNAERYFTPAPREIATPRASYGQPQPSGAESVGGTSFPSLTLASNQDMLPPVRECARLSADKDRAVKKQKVTHDHPAPFERELLPMGPSAIAPNESASDTSNQRPLTGVDIFQRAQRRQAALAQHRAALAEAAAIRTAETAGVGPSGYNNMAWQKSPVHPHGLRDNYVYRPSQQQTRSDDSQGSGTSTQLQMMPASPFYGPPGRARQDAAQEIQRGDAQVHMHERAWARQQQGYMGQNQASGRMMQQQQQGQSGSVVGSASSPYISLGGFGHLVSRPSQQQGQGQQLSRSPYLDPRPFQQGSGVNNNKRQ